MKDRKNNYASTKPLSDIVDDVSNKVDNNYDIDGVKAVRKEIDRNCDIILRNTQMAHSNVLEYGAGEVGCLNKFNGNKQLRETGLKLPKTLHDMLNNLYDASNRDVSVLRKIETIRLSFSHLHLDVPKGHCSKLSRLSRRKLTISENLILPQCSTSTEIQKRRNDGSSIDNASSSTDAQTNSGAVYNYSANLNASPADSFVTAANAAPVTDEASDTEETSDTEEAPVTGAQTNNGAVYNYNTNLNTSPADSFVTLADAAPVTN
ncbi:hypothetical protein G6F37_010824 [Rhizopus arrhizus]|nr:hypothetical protein G6F38_011962 [Rhizopus arrhizus]KAG1152261.1 hypothetical protein G6F37_010824 [Rhizopus arrhizus]